MTTISSYPKEKEALLIEPPGNLVIVAPPGCGKTEALALRAKGLLDSRSVRSPQRILTLAFSNRARDNIGHRINALVGGATFRQRIDLTNFHGFAARVFQAHAVTIGEDPTVTMPEKGWLKAVLSSIGGSYDEKDRAAGALQRAKLEPRTDEEVLGYLESAGSPLAVQVEEIRRQERRLDYPDVLRHAQRILLNEQVARLYSLHYAAIIVDEFQDLTPQQLSLVLAVSRDNATFAGDLGQAIYSFGGAEPDTILSSLRNLKDVREIAFNESYRSSPAVLKVLSDVGQEAGLEPVYSAEPTRWRDGGFSGAEVRHTPEDEAHYIRSMADALMASDLSTSIGLISRAGYRRKQIDQVFGDGSVPYQVFVWDNPIHRPEVLKLLRQEMERIDRSGLEDGEVLDLIEQSAIDVLDPADVESIDDVREACSLLREGLGDASDLQTRLQVIAASGSPDRVVGPGVHLLNAHVGKGQQFDWVFVLGLEEGHVPMFLAKTAKDIAEEHRTLIVMISRARHGVVLTRAIQNHTRYGLRASTASRWWQIAAAACDVSQDVGDALQQHLADDGWRLSHLDAGV